MTTYKVKDLVGQRFGRLEVIQFVKIDKNRKSCWNCVCDCGEQVVVTRNRLMSGNTTSCGCYNKEILSLPKGQASTNKILYTYKRNALRRGISFRVSKERFIQLIEMNCYYCGISPERYFKNTNANGGVLYNGLDRIDSSKGYEDNNIVPCCKNCNYAKNTMTYSEFKSWLKRISDHMLSKEILYA